MRGFEWACYADDVKESREVIFYDGHCGLCHRLVRFALWADGAGDRFAFAPLQGETFRQMIGPADVAGLPDSVVIGTGEGALLVRSAAVRHILRRLGGAWRAVAFAAGLVPAPLLDALYNFIARIRYRIFGRAPDVCPIVPPALRPRFLP